MTVNTNHEEERKVVSVPESLETLLTNLAVSGTIHQNHDQEHEMATDSSGLGVVDIQSDLFADLCV